MFQLKCISTTTMFTNKSCFFGGLRWACGTTCCIWVNIHFKLIFGFQMTWHPMCLDFDSNCHIWSPRKIMRKSKKELTPMFLTGYEVKDFVTYPSVNSKIVTYEVLVSSAVKIFASRWRFCDLLMSDLVWIWNWHPIYLF